MPNVPTNCNALKGNPHCDSRTTTGNGGYGGSKDNVNKVLNNYARNVVTSGKAWPGKLPISAGNYGQNAGKAWSRQPEGPVSTGGKTIGDI